MSPTKAEWKSRIDPHLSSSLRTASEKITRSEAVQGWLQEASMEAAGDIDAPSGMQGKMEGYRRVMDALEDRFPELLAAVDELTEGCGHVDLHWRPMHPNFSRLYITFDRDFSVSVFVRLSDATTEAVREAIETVADALPEGAPFPNRPNEATGLVAWKDQCIGVRVREHAGENENRRYRRVSLLPKGRDTLDKLSLNDAETRLLQLLTSDGSDAYP